MGVEGLATAPVFTLIGAVLMCIIGSPFYSAGFVHSGPKLTVHRDIPYVSAMATFDKQYLPEFMLMHVPDLQKIATSEIDVKHAAVYKHAAVSGWIKHWVVLTSFTNMLAAGFAVAGFVIFFLGTFLGLPFVNSIGTLLRLFQPFIIIPGVLSLCGYTAWCNVYFAMDVPSTINSGCEFIPKFITLAQDNGIPVNQIVKENYMYGVYAPLFILVISLTTTILMEIKGILFPPKAIKEGDKED